MNASLNKYIVKLIASALFLQAFVSCSNETPDDPVLGKTRALSFTFSTASAENTTKDEGIRTLKLVFVDDNNQIVDIHNFSKEDIEVNEKEDPILQGHIKLEIDAIPKAVYAFANIDDNTKIIQSLDDILIIGKKLEPLTAIAKIQRSLDISADNPIPMSSYRYELPEESGTLTTIYLYRMIGKVEVSITNQTGKDITVTNLKLGKFQHRNIFLMPYDDLQKVVNGDNTINPEFPENNNTEKNYDLDLDELERTVNPNAIINQHYYVHESDLGDDHITISATITGRDKTYTEPTEFTFVRRNDFLKIPLFVSDYDLVAKIREERAPIGGYPYVIEESRPLTQTIDYEIRYGGKIEVELSLKSEESTETDFTLTSVKKLDTSRLIEEENITLDNKKLTFHATGKTGNATLTLNIQRGSRFLTYTINLSRKEIK